LPVVKTLAVAVMGASFAFLARFSTCL
jgi:hypothetical protein